MDTLENLIYRRKNQIRLQKTKTHKNYIKKYDYRKPLTAAQNPQSAAPKKTDKQYGEGLAAAEFLHKDLLSRIRALGHPAILFGEDSGARSLRLNIIESEIEIDDGLHEGGIQENTLLRMQKEGRKHLINESVSYKHYSCTTYKTDTWLHDSSQKQSRARDTGLFKALEYNKMGSDERCLWWIHKWCNDWKKDLDSRPTEVIQSALGRRASNDYNSTLRALHYLFDQLKSHVLAIDIKKGIVLMVQAMKDRNYAHAHATLLNVIAIGNSPWPIGVTQVGIHTKSAAREKISSSHLNANAAAHIMGDEATRKYLHGLKRLLTAMQRIYPTHPSRCVEFHGETDPAKGEKGNGSTKLALMSAKRLAPTYSLLQCDKDKTVRVPDKMSRILKETSFVI